MSSVLHPVGPEPEERYWVRRLAVLVGLVVALVVIIALVVNATSAGSAVQAAPSVPPPAPTVPAATPTATPTSSATLSATPTQSGSATPSADPSATPSASATATTDTEAAKDKAKREAATKAKQKAEAKPKPAPVVQTCAPGRLRATLTGDRTPPVEQDTTFSLSLINGSGTTCDLKVNSENFVLTVVSGSDRVWTSKDCATTVPSLNRRLKPEQAAGWTVVWNGQRSAAGCRNRSEKPRPGTYFAIATFDDATAVRLRMVAHD